MWPRQGEGEKENFKCYVTKTAQRHILGFPVGLKQNSAGRTWSKCAAGWRYAMWQPRIYKSKGQQRHHTKHTTGGASALLEVIKKKKYIDYLKATEYNLFVSLFFLRNFSWSVDLLGNGPSCHWMGRLEIHVANKGVVLPRQKLFISLAESCCGQESVLLGWNKSSMWFQDNLPL